jgi:hypothetical protein
MSDAEFIANTLLIFMLRMNKHGLHKNYKLTKYASRMCEDFMGGRYMLVCHSYDRFNTIACELDLYKLYEVIEPIAAIFEEAKAHML